MRGLGEFQRRQMKRRDARVFLMCQHLRSALDVFEQIMAEPFHPPDPAPLTPEPEAPRPTPRAPASKALTEPAPATPVRIEGKLAYTMKEAASAVGLSRSTLYAALRTGALHAVKLGGRTLVPADALEAWLKSMPRARADRA